jgi:hypothetical protein
MRKYQGASPIPDRAFWKSVRDVRRNLLDAAGCA